MRIYLDVCSFNRPFDDQSQLRIRLEAEAKFRIQEEIRARKIELVWSYILDYENAKNPYQERKVRISGWRDYAKIDVQESTQLLATAGKLHEKDFRTSILCALHVLAWRNASTLSRLTTES